MVRRVLGVIGCGLLLSGSALAQPAIPTVFRPVPAVAVAGSQDKPKPDALSFAEAGTMIPTSSDGKFGGAANVFTLRTYGRPAGCEAGACRETVGFELSIDSNVVYAVGESVDAIREYVVSKKGSPLSMSFPFRTWTNKLGAVKQTYTKFQPYATARWIPLSGADKTNSGALAIGFTTELHIDADVIGEDTNGDNQNDTVLYTGFFFVSASPSASLLLGDELKTLVYKDASRHDYTWGVDVRAGYSFRGTQPLSLTVNVTVSPKGFSESHTSLGVSLTKALGANHKASKS
jgi:hypothetical protein